MCGFCGILNFSRDRIDDVDLRRMTETLRHRGPDHSHTVVCGPVGLGHTRLKIVDLTDAGNQPMTSHDGTCILSYNGEVYNFLSLRQRLESSGVVFRGRSDTEVVLEAYRHWGTEVFKMLDGMFAFALWDKSIETLFIVRDRFGIKPAYYFSTDQETIFGSEIKAILAADSVQKRLSIDALHEYLYFGAPLGENTIYQDIHRLLPGHYLSISRKARRISQYVDILDTTAQSHEDETTAVRNVRTYLESSVRSHMVADVPVGLFLSGGMDSSTLTALASACCPGRLRTYSVGFDFQGGINELPMAKRVAEHFGTEHHELFITTEKLTDTIEALVRFHDEPFGDAANIPLYLLCKELKGEIKVVLQGDGGDEIFAGYHRYNRIRNRRLFKVGEPLFRTAASFYRKPGRLSRSLRTMSALSQKKAADMMALLMAQERIDRDPKRVFTEEFQERLSATDPFKRYKTVARQVKHHSPVQQMLYTDVSIILPDVYFKKVDTATMANGIEVRVPMLDNTLAGYVMGLPSKIKLCHGRKKHLLRSAMADLLPGWVLKAPKTGFSVPMRNWLRKPLAGYLQSVLLDPRNLKWGLFNAAELERCIREHISGTQDNGFLLNKLLNLSLWYAFAEL